MTTINEIEQCKERHESFGRKVSYNIRQLQLEIKQLEETKTSIEQAIEELNVERKSIKQHMLQQLAVGDLFGYQSIGYYLEANEMELKHQQVRRQQVDDELSRVFREYGKWRASEHNNNERSIEYQRQYNNKLDAKRLDEISIQKFYRKEY